MQPRRDFPESIRLNNTDYRTIKELAQAGFVLVMNYKTGGSEFMEWQFPDDWWDEYHGDKHQFYDPVLLWAGWNEGRIRWSEIKIKDESGVFEAASRHGLNHGIMISATINKKTSALTAARSDREFSDYEMNTLNKAFLGLVNVLLEQDGLTLKEIQMLKMLSKGMEVTDIATELGVSRQSIMRYGKSIRDKLDCTNNVQATHVATRKGYI